jgi:lipopolysaccharide export system permease protein
MKKTLFRKLLLDCIIFLIISLISASIIIWVFQAVNFLDIMVEDGRDFFIYISYSILNFPKIISKILPFATFFSFCYVITKYELNNELIIFWNFGVNKIELINFFLKFSIILVIVQIFFTSYIVPQSQNYSRSLIRNSNVDFFDSFVKPKKFNDNIKGLTIYADQKNKDGKLINIYLKKDSGNKDYQITFAKTGEFKNIGKSKILILYDGSTVNIANKKVTNFNFKQSDFTLSQFDSDVITQDKIQETSTKKHLLCLNRYFNKYFLLIKNPPQEFMQNCSLKKLDGIFQEIYKRLLLPLYIPTLILISLLLIIKSKENSSFNMHKIFVYIFGFFIVISSESSLKLVQSTFVSNLLIFIAPILTIFLLYFFYKLKFSNKIKI